LATRSWAVLADQSDARLVQRAEVLGGDVLGRHQHAHVRGIAPGRAGGDGDAAAQLREALAHDLRLGNVLLDHWSPPQTPTSGGVSRFLPPGDGQMTARGPAVAPV